MPLPAHARSATRQAGRARLCLASPCRARLAYFHLDVSLLSPRRGLAAVGCHAPASSLQHQPLPLPHHPAVAAPGTNRAMMPWHGEAKALGGITSNTVGAPTSPHTPPAHTRTQATRARSARDPSTRTRSRQTDMWALLVSVRESVTNPWT
jgi:hypothetical protein